MVGVPVSELQETCDISGSTSPGEKPKKKKKINKKMTNPNLKNLMVLTALCISLHNSNHVRSTREPLAFDISFISTILVNLQPHINQFLTSFSYRLQA